MGVNFEPKQGERRRRVEGGTVEKEQWDVWELTSSNTPLPSTLASTLPLFDPLSPPNLTLTSPVPTLSHFPSLNLEMAPRASHAVSSPSSPTPFSIRDGSDGIVGAGASSSIDPEGVDVDASRAGVVVVLGAGASADPNPNDDETDRLGTTPEAAPKEKLGVPPGRR